MPKAIVVVSTIILFGILAGAIGYMLTHSEPIQPEPAAPPISKNKCEQKAKVDMACSMVGYEFDSGQKKCVAINGAGCIDKLPFRSLKECQEACEVKTEIKSAIAGEEFLITLDANPSTGYSWEADFDENYLMLRSKEFVSDKVSPEMAGAGGKEVFTFAPLKAGETAITMNYGRSWESKPSEIKVFRYSIKEKTAQNQTIVVSTDKTEYGQGEMIKIVVNNGLENPILYSGSGDRFWSIEYFEDGRWVNPYSKKGGDFQLTEKNIGDACYIALYERSFPEELASQSNLTAQWNQKICPFGTEGLDKPKIVRYIESGKYRLVFYYGFKISSSDPFEISEPKAVYSNEFAIKEKAAADTIDFYSCNIDLDCIAVNKNYCGCNAGGSATAINKRYLADWKGERAWQEGVACPAVMSDDPSCFGKPKCINNECVLQ